VCLVELFVMADDKVARFKTSNSIPISGPLSLETETRVLLPTIGFLSLFAVARITAKAVKTADCDFYLLARYNMFCYTCNRGTKQEYLYRDQTCKITSCN